MTDAIWPFAPNERAQKSFSRHAFSVLPDRCRGRPGVCEVEDNLILRLVRNGVHAFCLLDPGRRVRFSISIYFINNRIFLIEHARVNMDQVIPVGKLIFGSCPASSPSQGPFFSPARPTAARLRSRSIVPIAPAQSFAMLSLYAPVCGFSAAPIAAPRMASASVQMSVADMCVPRSTSSAPACGRARVA